MVETNNDFKYDLKIGQAKENELASILSDSTIEVKYDKYSNDTFFIEVCSKRFKMGKWRIVESGLSKTEATHYALIKSNITIIITTIDLMCIVSNHIKKSGLSFKENLVSGGDGMRTKGILITIEEITNYQNSQRNSTK